MRPISQQTSRAGVALALVGVAGTAAIAEAPPREDTDSPSPVTIIDREQIERRGLTDIDQIARLGGVNPGINTFTNVRGVGAPGSEGSLGLGVFLRSRYTWSERDDSLLGDDETTIGYSIPRLEITAAAGVTDSVTGVISVVTRPGNSGEFELENAFAYWEIDERVALTVGQFMPAVRRGDMIHESGVGGLGRTTSHDFFAGEYQQGVQLSQQFDETSNWWWSTYISDGPRTDNSPFEDSGEFDIAWGGRFEYKPRGTWDQFTDVTSFRGDEEGLLFGLGGFIALDGETNPSSVSDLMLCSLSGDVNYENDGARIGATIDWLQEDLDGSPTIDYFGWGVEGGVFLNEQTELFGRLEQILVDDDLALTDDEFLFLRGGLNYFLIPGSQAARLSFDIGYAFDPTAPLTGLGIPGSAVMGVASDSGFVGSSEDGELVFRGQFQGRF